MADPRTFNEFQRELRNRGIDGHPAYMFTLLYERLSQLAQQQEQNAKATLAIAETIQSMVQLHEATQARVLDLYKSMHESGVDVGSVAPDPFDQKN